LKHWRCGGILYYVRLVPLLIKDTKAHCLSAAWRYSSAELKPIGEQKVKNKFVVPPYCQCNFIIFKIFSKKSAIIAG